MRSFQGLGYWELRLLTFISLALGVSGIGAIGFVGRNPPNMVTSPAPNLRIDSHSQECVKEVDDTLAPKCRIIFREEGGWPYTFNATCIKPNVFLVNHDRNISDKITRTSDQMLFTLLYGEKPPPYARITCTAPIPIDFDYQGPGVLDFLRIWKSIKYSTLNSTEASGTTYAFNAEILLTPEATGKYVIHSIDRPEFQTSFFIFSSKPETPYLIGSEDKKTETQPSTESTSETVIPCITSNYNVTLRLFKQAVSTSTWMLYNDMKRYDPEQGFIVPTNSANPGDVFKCTTGLVDDADSIQVTVPTHTTSGTPERASTLRIEISESGGAAVCYFSNGQPVVNMKFYNVFARNPTEAHLVAECLQRGRPNCGGHTYHERKEGRGAAGTVCRNSTSCSLIPATHKEGLLVCISGNDFISTEYFTGLDNKIYKDWNLAPRNALIRPRYTPPLGEFATGTKYEFKCESVGLIFVKDPYVISVQYKNGTVQKLADLVWWQSGKEFYLTKEMDQVICNDQEWTTHTNVNSSIKVNVTEKKCAVDQFTCGNGQCIRDTWRCDGDKDCTDETDEHDCHSHVCKPGHFKCLGGQCISNEKLCNNKRECPDGSDEMAATCRNKTCNVDDFKCSAGQCIPAHFLCDGDKDCIDESDEASHSCSKYYPQISGNQHVTFTENSLNELVCETNTLPAKLAPRMEWWFQEKNITDENRLWRGLSGNKLALRFVNISAADQGDYTCYAQNMLTKVDKTFTVQVQQHDVSCKSTLPRTECLRRGCAFNPNLRTCYDYVDFVETSSISTVKPAPATGSTTLRTVVIGGSSTSKPTDSPHIDGPEYPHYNPETVKQPSDEEESGHGFEITFGILFFLIVCALGAGIGWRYYTRRYVPAGSARMREDDQVTLNGI